jgi:hypothetical protein
MDVFMRQGTNYAEPTGIVTQAPYNQFSHARAFPPADFKAVVRPNVDTLYSSANLDLGPEPLVLSVPATDRYFMLPLLSVWTPAARAAILAWSSLRFAISLVAYCRTSGPPVRDAASKCWRK